MPKHAQNGTCSDPSLARYQTRKHIILLRMPRGRTHGCDSRRLMESNRLTRRSCTHIHSERTANTVHTHCTTEWMMNLDLSSRRMGISNPKFVLGVLLLGLCVVLPATTSSASHSVGRTSTHQSSSRARTHHSRRATSSSIKRDRHGRIKRSSVEKHAFKKQHPCPSTGTTSGRCPGYVVDHVRPLECGGADAQDNMQWQTVAAGKAKDKTEGRCR
jgi:5-methylcytosine-specific restriction endonuclease McrA